MNSLNGPRGVRTNGAPGSGVSARTGILEHSLQLSLVNIFVVPDLIKVRLDRDIRSEEEDIVH